MAGRCVLMGHPEQGLVCDTRAGALVTAMLLKHSEWEEDHLHPFPSFLFSHCVIRFFLCYGCKSLVCERHIMLSLVCRLWISSAQWILWKQRMTWPCSLSQAPRFPSPALCTAAITALFFLVFCYKVLMFSTFHPKSGHCYFGYFTELSHIGNNVPQLCS